MYKLVTFFAVLAIAAVALAAPAEEVQDQKAAEQFFTTYGYYPAWYSGFRYAYPAAGVKYAAAAATPYAYAYPYGAFPYGYQYGFPAAYGYRYHY